MEVILIVALIFWVVSFADGSNKASKRTKRLDPGGRYDHGGKR